MRSLYSREMVLLMYAESKSLLKDFLKLTLAKESGVIEFFVGILRLGVRQKVLQIDDPFLWSM